MTFASKTLIAILVGCCFSVYLPQRSHAGTTGPYIVIDAANGDIISARREADQWHPASLTKLMTAYVTMKAIQDSELEVGSPVHISRNASRMPASRMGYGVGTKIRVDTALKILIVKSANDVAIALAETVAGSVEKFSLRMNQTAARLGMNASNFANPNGLHATNQLTSARDMAILSRRLLLDFPQYSHWFAIPAIKTTTKTHYSYNLLLERFSGANGMKTGFICASGYNMVASAKRQGRQLIVVVLGANSQTQRAVTAAQLLNEAFEKPEMLIGNLLSGSNQTNTRPENMRSQLCTPEARKHRYEPGAGKAIIKSAFLTARQITRQPLLITTGNIDAAPGKYSSFGSAKIVPTRRPDYTPPQPFAGQLFQNTNLRGAIPAPIRRP